MREHYDELAALFPLDPLLVFAVAYLCPMYELADLCDNIDLPYAIALVAKKLEPVNEFTRASKVR